ncbi:MAG: hypothetical protein WAM39_02265 [Bryobacteraceae bacterium]
MNQSASLISAWRKHRFLIALLALVMAIALWWLFRPELLFINKQVNQAAPAGIAAIQPVFTASLHPIDDASGPHGRVNILRSGHDLQLEISNLQSNAAKSFTVALGPSESVTRAAVVGRVTVAGHERLALPSGLDPAGNRTVLLTDDSHRILATATLEPF